MTELPNVEGGKISPAEYSRQAELKSELVFRPDTRALVVMACTNPDQQPRAHEQALMRALNEVGVGTLRVELLTSAEAENANGAGVEIATLAERVRGVAIRLRELGWSEGLDLGYYASGEVASAAVRTADREEELGDALVICDPGRTAEASDAQNWGWQGSFAFDAALLESGPDPELVKDLFRNWLHSPERSRTARSPGAKSCGRELLTGVDTLA